MRPAFRWRSGKRHLKVGYDSESKQEILIDGDPSTPAKSRHLVFVRPDTHRRPPFYTPLEPLPNELKKKGVMNDLLYWANSNVLLRLGNLCSDASIWIFTFWDARGTDWPNLEASIWKHRMVQIPWESGSRSACAKGMGYCEKKAAVY